MVPRKKRLGSCVQIRVPFVHDWAGVESDSSMASTRLTTGGDAPTTTSGWARFESSVPVQAVATFELRNKGVLTTTAGLLGSQPISKFVMPIEATTNANSDFAVANPDPDKPTKVSMTVFDEFGKKAFSGTMSVLNPMAPLAQTVGFVTSVFPTIPSGFKGVLLAEVDGAGSMIATALTVKEGMLSTIPAADVSGLTLISRVLSRLFRRLFLKLLQKAFESGKLYFFSSLEALRDLKAFLRYLAPVRKKEWVVYAKAPFAGPAYGPKLTQDPISEAEPTQCRTLIIKFCSLFFLCVGSLCPAPCHDLAGGGKAKPGGTSQRPPPQLLSCP